MLYPDSSLQSEGCWSVARGQAFTFPGPGHLNLGPPRGGTRIHQNFSLSPRSPKITDLLPQASKKLPKPRPKVVFRTPKYHIIEKCGTLRKHQYLLCFSHIWPLGSTNISTTIALKNLPSTPACNFNTSSHNKTQRCTKKKLPRGSPNR